MFEFEDFPWFPNWLRDYGTDFLRAISDRADYYEHIIPIMNEVLERSNESTFIDIASGGGGGWEKILRRLIRSKPEVKVVLTDLYPNHAAFAKLESKFPEHVTRCAYPVDALEVPPCLRGVRTQFMSFHHFEAQDAQQILANAVAQCSPVLIVEAQERNVFNLLKFIALSPLSVWLVTPGIRPFKWRRILFTYLLPIVPAYLLWDGLVSVCRTYTLDELLDFAYRADPDQAYIWEVGKTESRLMPVCYLLGYPVENHSDSPSGTFKTSAP
ncbi:hypothetical protein GCM10011386_23080 [Parapedobacter defluvii]|uniref:Class I SAM-dependent methyltransferase n=1 Tax=Parapedobacter defluvii TaxID=2045106 RepID=A0ABQ1LZ16_9SPHI|nr:hypothetical protein GCM10011386_23080 [Parapedobacter defluvii]